MDLLSIFPPKAPQVGIVVGRSGSGTHAGILYVHGGVVVIIHQRWHHLFANEPFEAFAKQELHSGFAYSVPNIEPEQHNDVIGWCRLIERRYLAGRRLGTTSTSSLPFALKYDPATQFVPEGSPVAGSLKLSEDGLGLTCSTFVLTVFASAKIELIKVETWEQRPDDDKRHRDLIKQLLEHKPPIPTRHIKAVEAQLPCVRFRPEEMVGACMHDQPGEFHQTAEVGKWIMSILDACPAPAARRAVGVFLRPA